MRIAFTGASSTGKSTLARLLTSDAKFRTILPEFISVDARALLASKGFGSMDNMNREQLRDFQCTYLNQKIVIEAGRDAYLTDRSFVDVAAYWLERDAEGLSECEVKEFVESCRYGARRYDLHFFFPTGLFPFTSDGYRSEEADFHKRIDAKITALIHEWEIDAVRLDMIDLETRRNAVVSTLAARAMARHD